MSPISHPTTELESQPQVTRFRVEGMDCADCARKLEGVLSELEPVIEARVNFAAGLLTVTHSGDADVVQQVREQVARAGYRAYVADGEAEREAQTAGWRRWLPRGPREWSVFLSGLAWCIGAGLHVLGAAEIASIPFYAVAMLVGGWPMARAGWATLRATRTFDMNVLMTVAVIGAAAIGEWSEGAAVVFLFSLGNWLEARTMEQARQSIRALLDLSPKTATLLHGDHTEQVLVHELKVGDRILVRPGERIPMDGTVSAGRSSVNQAPITGESSPVEKKAGDEVYAGTINGEGVLEIVISRLAHDNTLSRIVNMVEEAQAQRAPSQRLVDRFSRIYTPAVIALALAIAIVPPLLLRAPFVTWLYRALILLVISCPCALVISTPVTIVSAISRAARQGILIKGGAYLEEAGRLRAIALDKTGTLTTGHPRVTDVIGLNGYQPDELLAIAASIESSSEHALAHAILHEARHRGLAPAPADDFQALAGLGASARIGEVSYLIGSPTLMKERSLLDAQAETLVSQLQAQGRIVSLVARAGDDGEAHLIGIIGMADPVRPHAAEAIAELKASGIAHIVMLTGDHPQTAQAIAAQLGIDDVRAGLLPAQKVQVVEALLAQYGQVAMVGDGVNDAPALARASLGIAMGAAGTDVALETADIALMSDDVSQVATAIRLSRQARRIVAQNIAVALLLKGLFLGLAVAGVATLWMAVFADMGASLMVTLNGMRMLRARG